MPSYEFHTLGCKVNQYESEAMEALLREHGYHAAQGEAADLYVINTCTVTHVSDRKSRQQIRRMKRENPNAVVAVVGCYAQVAPEALEALDEVDVLMGTKGRDRLVELVEAFQRTGERQIALADLDADRSFDPLEISDGLETTRATIKIQDGCDRYCTYCIIPYARGHIVSRPLDDILREAERLVQHGFKELVLTGIHVASYGKEKREGVRHDLLDVIEQVASLSGVERLRLSSMEPRWVTPERLERLRALSSFCPHFHLSLQSGSDRILQKMNRAYTTAIYRQKVEEIRRVFPDAGLTTDVIVGFPEETEADFQETVSFCREMGFSRIHIFPYSPREGTPAALFEGQVDSWVKKNRVRELGKVEEELRFAFMDRTRGTVVQVLWEACDADGVSEGYTPNYLRVAAPHAAAWVNQVTPVRIVGRKGDVLQGEILEDDTDLNLG